MSPRRILTVASGKGGVGKSTFAVNFALTLARVAPTVLVDLDAGTSSIRNTLDAPVGRDLYHFFRKDEPLEACLTRLPDALDPDGRFRDFAFVAAPRHAIEEFTNLSESHRARLIRAVNRLPATYVILDLRAGLDTAVLDFLPHSNSGVLVFTPHHPAARVAAADIVKALLFRKLRLVFAPEGALAGAPGAGSKLSTINALLDQVEDAYDERIPNLDRFLAELLEAFGDGPIVRALSDCVASFEVHFVLNFFDGVRESFDAAVAPFVAQVHEQVSAGLPIHNLGWIVTSPEVHEGNCRRRPVVLDAPVNGRSRPDPVAAGLEALEAFAGVRRDVPPPRRPATDYLLSIDPDRALADQLEVLNAMYRDPAALQVRDNFAYIARRALHAIANRPPEGFGQRRLLTHDELADAILGDAAGLTPDSVGGEPEAPPL